MEAHAPPRVPPAQPEVREVLERVETACIQTFNSLVGANSATCRAVRGGGPTTLLLLAPAHGLTPRRRAFALAALAAQRARRRASLWRRGGGGRAVFLFIQGVGSGRHAAAGRYRRGYQRR